MLENETGKLYQQHCQKCHGVDFEVIQTIGNSPDRAHTQITQIIKKGSSGKNMPAFEDSLTNDQISLLTFYVLKKMDDQKANFFWPYDSTISDTFITDHFSFIIDTVAIIDSFIGEPTHVVPWGLSFLPNGDILGTERSGLLYRIDSNQQLHWISGVPEVSRDEHAGLLDIEAHPDFENNKLIYLTYTRKGEFGPTTILMKAELSEDRLLNRELLFEAYKNNQPCFIYKSSEYGSRIEFDENNRIYVSMGDRSQSLTYNVAQDLASTLGKIHRFNDDGSIPSDNPFVDTVGALETIYALGIRNPQGLARNPVTGSIWSSEHGPRGGDEVNLIKAGKNYGWPLATFGVQYDGSIISNDTSLEGMEDPIRYWVPSVALGGMDFVQGSRYPGWEGDLFVTSMKYVYIHRFILEGDSVVGEEELFRGAGINRVRDIEFGIDSLLYFTTEGEKGCVLRLLPIKIAD